jgi:branched-subunit amino acid aminotransferase/4-amino-4-deoxychorismate lyase
LRQAAAGAGEAIWLNISNHLASGAVSNLFLVKAGTVFTPLARGEEVKGALPAPVLPGITRAAVLQLGAELGIEARRQMLAIDDLLDADEVFLTNSSWQLLPVTRVEKKPIGDGQVGPWSRRLRAALLDQVEQETGT